MTISRKTLQRHLVIAVVGTAMAVGFRSAYVLPKLGEPIAQEVENDGRGEFDVVAENFTDLADTLLA